jgi:DNA-binding winged helix-turn-helix (wHTH) protein/tetratricopeptide (TPR) repeat protein
MSNPTPKARYYRFGPFELDPEAGTLTRDRSRVRLQDLPFRFLLMLVERPGEIITREDVRQRLWPENTFVEFDNSLGVAVRKVRDSLNDDAEAPRYVETIPRRGYRFLAPVTVHEPDQATDIKQVPAIVADAPKTSVSDLRAAAGGSPGGGFTGSNRPWVIAALILLMVGGAVYWFRSAPRRAASKAEAAGVSNVVRVRRSVAVLGFRNLPGRAEDNWLSPAFTEMLNTELAAGGTLRMVSGEDVARAKSELSLADEDSLARATLERLRKNPGADVVVLGSYTSLPGEGGKRIRLDVRLQDTARGETIAERAFTGSEDSLFELATQAGGALRQSLGVSAISSEAANAARASLPSNQLAARLYTDGRAKLWRFDFHGASDVLVKAVAADPNYPLAHSALSEAWWHIGYEVKARAEAQRALELSTQLPQEEKLLVEGQYRRTLGEWHKAAEAYQELFHLFPDSLDHGLLLASAQVYDKPTDALTTLAALRRLPAPAGDDPRIDMVEAEARINSDVTKARQAAQLAISKARAQGSHAIAARTYAILCELGTTTGDSNDAIGDCENALQSAVAAKDVNGEALMRVDLAALHYQKGDLAVSTEMFRKAIDQFRQVGNLSGVAAAQSNFAAVLLVLGDLKQAKKLLEAAIPDYQAVEDRQGIALALNNLGDLERQSGNLDVAETTYQQAKATAQESDNRYAIAYVLFGMGDVLADRGDLVAARKSYEESLALRTQSGEKQNAAEDQVALARLSVEEGHAAAAEPVLRQCKEQFQREQQADDQLTASVVLTRALLAQNKYPDALKEVESSAPLAAKNQNRLTRLEFDVVAARVKLASDHPESSRAQLESIVQDARAHGFVGIELEARLARAELESKIGSKVSAQIEFASLEKSALAKGFGLIAAKAADYRTTLQHS